MQTARFTEVVESFDCGYCGRHVDGDGCTNHCPGCLTSMHVDRKNPGDRASDCHGLMLAVGWGMKNGKEYIIQKCVKCGHVHKNKISPKDSRDALVALASGQIEAYRENLLLQKKMQVSIQQNKKSRYFKLLVFQLPMQKPLRLILEF